MSINYRELKAKYICKWSKSDSLDKKLTYFSTEFENWINQVDENMKEIIINLLDNFDYYSRIEVNKILKSLHNDLISSQQLSIDDTVYSFIKSKDGISNSSNDYWTEYKLINQLNNNTCIENLDAIDNDNWCQIRNLIIIDDFCGTGNSFLEFLKPYEKTLSQTNVNIFYITIQIMKQAEINLNSYAKENSLNLILINYCVREKAFTKNIIYEYEEAMVSFKSYSKKIKIPKNNIFGYKKSQSLVAFHNNTPNNTLGIFRYDTDENKSLFPRKHEETPNWQKMQSDEKARGVKNYNAKVGGFKSD